MSASVPISIKDTPLRFKVAKPTLIFDYFMNHFIRVGGILVVAAIAGIFVFILSQIVPLFYAPSVHKDRVVSLGDSSIAAMAVDPWSDLPMFVTNDGSITFLDLIDEGGEHNRGSFAIETHLSGEDHNFTFTRYNQRHGILILGTDQGQFTIVSVDYQATHPPNRGRVVVPEVKATPLFDMGREGVPFELFDYADAGQLKLAAAVQLYEGRYELHAATMRQKRTLLGVGELEFDRNFDLTELLDGEPQQLLITGDGDFIIVSTNKGAVNLIAREGNNFNLRQTFYPFEDLSNSKIQTMNLLNGDVSLIFSNPAGKNRIYSVYHDQQFGSRIFGKTNELLDLPEGASFFSTSIRNKGFLTGSKNFASLRYATTGDIRWQKELDFNVQHAVLGGRYDKILFVDDTNRLHLYDLNDKHPRAGWRSYFGKIHYEGRSGPEYMWQSTGGSDTFEPKISMVPLIVGTIKGTIYAMMFALPISLLCAVYTSQFLNPAIRRTVKPLMEIMESVPTVVLGFLAALWLAPLISDRVPSFLLLCFGIPVSALLVGIFTTLLPGSIRVWLKPGYEFLFYLPFMFIASWLCWHAGPIVEQMFFISIDPDSGVRTADFRLWLSNEAGIPFEQRNALVVGFLMGFAVIPTIFTIAEDAMANVPGAFKSASLALGASRWQTAMNIVIPTAAAGIFSAIMIGFGRAVGETMIVLMATGNTPVMNLNIFEGMRTLSANIAVELPEAAHGGTLYRSLFLGAMLLFLMTFIVNTAAELLRQYLREKYKAVE